MGSGVVGVVHEEINTFKNYSGLFDSIGLAQMCLQSDPKCYKQISTKFLFQRIFYCLTHSLTDAFSRA